MIVNADVKSLEVVVAADLSRDKVLTEEILDKQDIHGNNRKAFNLPDRKVAKGFKFKLLYGASSYGFAKDVDFFEVSRSEKFWQEVIDSYYKKYYGIGTWHKRQLDTVKRQRYLEIPSGRYFPMNPIVDKGRVRWPETIIKNYPVQGFGADLVKLARIRAYERVKAELNKSVMICTVHDSLVADSPDDEWEQCAKILYESIAEIPKLCYNIYSYKFSLPITSEILVGKNKNQMEEYKC